MELFPHPFDPELDQQVTALLDIFDKDRDQYWVIHERIRAIIPTGPDYYDIRALAPDTQDRFCDFMD